MCLFGLQIAGTEKIKKNETMKFINPKNILFEKNLYIKQIDRSSRIFLFVSPIRPAVGVLPLFIVSYQTSHGQAMVKKHQFTPIGYSPTPFNLLNYAQYLA